jgi:hypothetical protein
LIEVLFCDSANRSEAAAARVSEEDVEPPFFQFDLCEKPIQVIQIRRISFNGRDVSGHQSGGGIQFGLSPAGNKDVRPFLDETLSSGNADSGRAACDKCDLSFKFS